MQWDALLARARRLFGFAVDDAHCHYDDIYGGWVMLKAADRSRAAIYQALRAGHFYATNGPTIESVQFEGDTVLVECSPAVECFAVCPMPGRGWTNWRGDADGEVHSTFELAMKPGNDPMRICIVDQHGRRAWTNPWWRG